MQRIHYLICCLVFMLCSTLATAEDRRHLKAGFLNFPPFKYVNEDGAPAGPWVELSERLAAEAGYTLEWHELPISRIYHYLINGNIDFWPGVANIPALAGAVVETTSTPLFLNLSAYHTAAAPPIETIDDLAGKNLILIAGFSYMGLLDEILEDDTTEAARAPSHLSALRMLALGRGQYLIDYDEPLQHALSKLPFENLRQSPLIAVRGAFVVSRRTEGAEAIGRAFDRAYQALHARGEGYMQ